jgi:hypothetical protein
VRLNKTEEQQAVEDIIDLLKKNPSGLPTRSLVATNAFTDPGHSAIVRSIASCQAGLKLSTAMTVRDTWQVLSGSWRN